MRSEDTVRWKNTSNTTTPLATLNGVFVELYIGLCYQYSTRAHNQDRGIDCGGVVVMEQKLMSTVTVCLLNLDSPSVANGIRLHGNRIMLQNHDSLVG